jgi:hypothetical protein
MKLHRMLFKWDLIFTKPTFFINDFIVINNVQLHGNKCDIYNC